MIKKTIRIDGNEKYDYAKVTVALVDDELYVVENNVTEFGLLESLLKVNEALVADINARGQDNISQLLHIIRERFAGRDYGEDWNELLNVNRYVVQAIKVCDITKKDQTDVGGIKGLTVTDW